MKRTLLLSLAFFSLFLGLKAHPIDLETAQSVAYKFMGTNDLQLSTTYLTKSNVAAFYIFNSTDGFVIVSADDCETPIIGYSHEGRFDPHDIPIQMEDYLNDFVIRIQYGIENHIVADEVTAKQWQLVKTLGKLHDHKSTQAIEPLLTDKWHQGCLYNSLCPTKESTPCGHAYVGCVALAMGQIMHYWGYPSKGWGSRTYYDNGVSLSANFGNTEYDWSHMPDSLTETSSDAEIEAVATLLFHCGVAVKMSYGANSSNANTSLVVDALTRYFDYSRQLRMEKQADYDNEEWMSLLKNCLDSHRPIQYSGSGDNIGHSFVCDGYDENDLLHFNWGWGGVANGYFALGNLYPNGNDLNNSNTALIDIIPQYDPCIISASAYPPQAGTIEGIGEYHIGEQCWLTAVPAENSNFLYWEKEGIEVSDNTYYYFDVEDDVDDIKAYFSYMPVEQISACYSPDTSNPNSPCVSLSWNYEDPQWTLLKQFDLNGEYGVAADGEHIYTCNYSSSSPVFGKYTMEGDLIEFFDMEGANPLGITYDGNYFYCSKNSGPGVFYLHCYDLAHKTIIDSSYMHMQSAACSYDAENDGFWLCPIFPNKQLILKDRQGQTIMTGPSFATYIGPCGSAKITAKDGTSHLLILFSEGKLYDYDLSNGILIHHPRLEQRHIKGISIGKYKGKDAMFVVVLDISHNTTALHIYAINSHLSRIIGYRLYRSDSEGHTVILADEVTESSYIDSTWNEIGFGVYRFGISPIYANGNESEIIWSDPIVKSGIGIDEHTDNPTEQSVQKVLENGQIVIIKDGKRYNVSGQKLN